MTNVLHQEPAATKAHIKYQLTYSQVLDYLGFLDENNRTARAIPFFDDLRQEVVYLPSTGSGLTELIASACQLETKTKLPIIPTDVLTELKSEFCISLDLANELDLTAYWFAKTSFNLGYHAGQKLTQDGYYLLFKYLTYSAGMTFIEIMRDHHYVIFKWSEKSAVGVLDDLGVEYDPMAEDSVLERMAYVALQNDGTAILANSHKPDDETLMFIYTMR